MRFVGDSTECTVDEGFSDGLAGSRERRDLEPYIFANRDSAAWDDELPLNSLNGYVLAGGADVDWMTLVLQGADDFQRIQANRALGPSVVFLIILGVIFEPQYAHFGASNPPFRDPASGNVY
jgi:hypothetical protein